MPKTKRLVRGIGINDADYVVAKAKQINGTSKRVWTCPYYKTWGDMLTRCYLKRYLKRNPSYTGSKVCIEWLIFSNFRNWMRQQQWIQFTASGDIEKRHLDKDFLSGTKRGKLYSPDTCVFVSRQLNSFLLDGKAKRGMLPLGVTLATNSRKFQARIRNPFTNKSEYLGSFYTAEEAQAFYVARKQEFAAMLAAEQTDPRIANALLNINWFD